MEASTFEAFKGVIAAGGTVRAIRIPGIANYSRKDMDDVRNLAISFGAKGLAWVTYMEDGEVKSPVFKFLTEEQIAELQKRSGAEKGDIVFFVADKPKVVYDVLGRFRLYFGKKLEINRRKQAQFALGLLTSRCSNSARKKADSWQCTTRSLHLVLKMSTN